MTSTAILGARMQQARERTLEIVDEHGPESAQERAGRIRAMGNTASIHNPMEFASAQAEMIAALGEMVEDLAARVPVKASAKKGAKKKAS